MIAPVIVTRGDRPDPKKPAEAAERRPKNKPRGRSKPARTGGTCPRGRGRSPAQGWQARHARGDDGRVRGKLTITNAFDERQRERSLASLKRKREREKQKAMGICPDPRKDLARGDDS